MVLKLPRGRRRIIAAVVGAVLVAAVVVPWTLTGAGASQNDAVVILAKVQPRTLQDTVQLAGTLARKSIRNVTAAAQGLVSSVYSTDGSTTTSGQAMFALNGRDAIAEPGSTPFFRSLEPGDTGDDVLELKQILAAAGDYPGSPTDDQFTEQTQFALAQWQAQHHYPNSTPATTETVNVALQEGTGYQIGAQASAGLTIGPPAAQDTAASSRGAHRGSLLAYQHDTTPSLSIQSVSDQVAQGQPADFVITASATSASTLTVNLDYGGTAGSSDIVTPPASATIPAGSTSTTVQVDTLTTTDVGSSTTLIVSLASGTGYAVGSPSSAQTTIANNNTPQLQITGGETVSPGGSATLTITADQAPVHDTQVLLSFGGNASPSSDYSPPDPVVTLAAGSTSTTVTVTTLSSNVIGADKYVVVSLTPSPGQYTIGSVR